MAMLTATQHKSKEQVTVVALEEEHIERAAVLFATGYQRARRCEPLLPACHEHAERILPRLRQLSRRGTGVAAMRQETMVGFLLGQVMRDSPGGRSVYVPEWAHAAAGRDAREIYQAMYTQASGRWMADGCRRHLITVLADGRQVVDTFLWFGFGLMCVDAMRELGPAPDDSSGVVVRRAEPADAPAVVEMERALQDHLVSAPIFQRPWEPTAQETVAEWLASADSGIFLACDGTQVLGYCRVCAANPSAAYIIDDPKTASIKAMFTRQDRRRRGIGRGLLNEAIAWACAGGYERLAVDFEPQNVPASRFWLEHFRPVCYSMMRHIENNDR